MEGQASTSPEARFGLALSAQWKFPLFLCLTASDWPSCSQCVCPLGRWGETTPSAGGAQQNLHRPPEEYPLLGPTMTLSLRFHVPDTFFVDDFPGSALLRVSTRCEFFFHRRSPSPLDLPVLALLWGAAGRLGSNAFGPIPCQTTDLVDKSSWCSILSLLSSSAF